MWFSVQCEQCFHAVVDGEASLLTLKTEEELWLNLLLSMKDVQTSVCSRPSDSVQMWSNNSSLMFKNVYNRHSENYISNLEARNT